MGYYGGGWVENEDYNNFIGYPTAWPAETNKINRPFANANEAAARLAAIYGVGYGDRGYGQIWASLFHKSDNETVYGSDWANVRNIIDTCARHQGITGALPLITPPASKFDPGAVITAHDAGVRPPYNEQAYHMSNALSHLDANRLNAPRLLHSGWIVVHENPVSWYRQIEITVSAQFRSENEARYFFNQGHCITIVGWNPQGTAQQNSWHNVLSYYVGQINFWAHRSEKSGSKGSVATGLGYYELTDAWQYVYYGDNLGDYAYTPSHVHILARREWYGGVNGANGRIVQFRIVLTDDYGGSGDMMPAGTKWHAGYHYTNNGAGQSPLPWIYHPEAWPSGGWQNNFTAQEMTIYIGGNVQNWVLSDAVWAHGWNGSTPIHVAVWVLPGVVVGAASTGHYAMHFNSFLPAGSTVTLHNQGYIVGAGGAGGNGEGSYGGGDKSTNARSNNGSGGLNGGPAILVQCPLTISNGGYIWAGGGGGAGGAAVQHNRWDFYSTISGTQWRSMDYWIPGGGGGGGAGWASSGAGVANGGTYPRNISAVGFHGDYKWNWDPFVPNAGEGTNVTHPANGGGGVTSNPGGPGNPGRFYAFRTSSSSSRENDYGGYAGAGGGPGAHGAWGNPGYYSPGAPGYYVTGDGWVTWAGGNRGDVRGFLA